MWRKGIEFEERCLNKLKRLGFQNVSRTPISGDYGADIVAFIDQIKYIFQCKDVNKRQGVHAIQEILGAKNIYKANRCVVISKSGFTPNAHKLAKVNFILLLTSEELFKAEDANLLLSEAFKTIENTTKVQYDYNVIEEYYTTKKRIGHTPTLSDLDKTLKYRIRKTYGNYSSFMELIGERIKRSAPTQNTIKEEYLRIRALLKRVPSANDIKANTSLPYNQFHTYPLTKLQKECGDIPNCDRSVTKIDLINEYLELEKKLGYKPNGTDIDKHGTHGSSLYIRRFGSLRKFYSLPIISATSLLKNPLNKKRNNRILLNA